MLTLPIKKKWLDMILNVEKKAEYREIKPYWTKRFAKAFDIQEDKLLEIVENAKATDENLVVPAKAQVVKFRNGYSNDSPTIQCKVKLIIGQGIEEWGAEPNTWYFILMILDIKRIN